MHPPLSLQFPQTTAMAAALLGVLFLVLTLRVIALRVSSKMSLGDGEGSVPALFIATRAHANFAEYVPLCLLLIGTIEALRGPTLLVQCLAWGLVLARLLHPVGMTLPAPNPYRAGGALGSILVLAVASITLLVTLFW